MDGPQIMESLDSLWFSSNVFSSKKDQTLNSASDGDHHEQLGPNVTPKLEESKPTTPNPQNQETQKKPDQKCPKCDEIVTESGPKTLILPEIPGFSRRPRSKRSYIYKSGLKGRWVSVGEFDWGKIMYFGDVGFVQWSIASQLNANIPPLNDGMAMKEYLKSWAYAVACAVR